MRILLVTADYGGGTVGGAQVSVRLLAEELARLGHAVAVASIDDGRPDADDWRHSGIARHRFAPRNLYWHAARRPPAVARLAWHVIDRLPRHHARDTGAVIDGFRPDVVHTHALGGIGTGPWLAARERGLALVHTVHDYHALCVNAGMRRGGNCGRPCAGCRAGTLAAARASAAVGGVIWVSRHVREAHRAARRFARAREEMVLAGPARAGDGGRATGQPLRFGFLGRLAPHKGVAPMLDEFRRLGPDGRWCLRIGGDGEAAHVAHLHARAAGLPVSFDGAVDARAFLSRVDVLVVPSLWHEPAARVVYEAGLAGVPAVVSRRGGLPELVADGRRGWIYEPDRPGELAALLDQCLRAPEAVAARAQAWRGARAQFDPAAVAEATLALYRRVIAGGS